MPPVASTTARARTGSASPRRGRATQADAAALVGGQRGGRARLEHLDPLVDGGERRQLARDAPAGGRAAGVHDAPARVAALEAEREVAVAVGVEADAEPLEVAHAPGRLLAQHPHRAGACGVAAGRERVLRCAARGSRRPPAPRRSRPAPRSEAVWASGERLTSATRAPCAAAVRAAYSPAAPAPTTATSTRSGWEALTAGTVPAARARLLQPSLVARARHRARPPGATRSDPGDRGGARSARLARLRAPRGACGHDRAAAGGAPAVLHRASAGDLRALAAPSTSTPRPRRGSWEAALHAAGRRLRAGRGAARTGNRSASPRCARPATTPSTRARWGSACSPTSRSPPATRSRSAPSGCSCSTGTCTTATAPTRSSTSRREVLFASLHQYPFWPGSGRAVRRRRGGRARATRSTCRCRRAQARTSTAGWSSTSCCRRRGRSTRTSCSCRPASTPTATTRSASARWRRARTASWRRWSMTLGKPVGYVLEGGYDLGALAALGRGVDGVPGGRRRARFVPARGAGRAGTGCAGALLGGLGVERER